MWQPNLFGADSGLDEMYCCSYLCYISSLYVSVAGGMLCSTVAGSVCTLCYAVGHPSVSHVLTASVRETRKDKVILDHQNNHPN